MRKFIASDPEKCDGCGVCELVCSASKDNAFNPRTSRIKTVKIEPLIDAALACRLCEKPACVRCCPQNALKQDAETGVIIVDEVRCDGCGWCVEVCDFGALTLHPDKKIVVVCDLCEGDPICTKLCPRQALEFTTLDTIAGRARRSLIRELFVEGRSSR